MRSYTEEIAAEIRARCANAIEIDVDDEGAVVVLRPFDQAGFDRYTNEGVRDLHDANENACKRQLVWPTVSELDKLRGRYACLDEELARELQRAAGDPLGDLVVDILNSDTPIGALERARLTQDDATKFIAMAADQNRRAAIILAKYGPDESFACVVLAPKENDLMPLRSTSDEAKKQRAQAFRTLALGCTKWTNEGDAAGAFARRPALPITLYLELKKLGGTGAIRARKSAHGRGAGNAG